MRDKPLKWWLRQLLQLLSLVIFILIVWWAGPEPWRQVLNADWQLLLLTGGIYGAANFVSSQRLRLVTEALVGEEVASRRRFFYLSMVARTLGLILPRGLSTLGGKSVGLRALGVPLKRSLWIVMMDNVYDVLSLAVIAVPAVFFLQEELSASMFGTLALLLWLLSGAGIWLLLRRGRLAPLLRWLANRVPWLARRLGLDEKVARELLPGGSEGLGAFLWTILLNLLLASTYFGIARALDLQASWWLFAACFPITQLSLIIAVAPGGLGIFDLGWLGLLRLGGFSQEEALTFVVAQRAIIFVLVLLWAGISALLSTFPATARAASG